MEDHKKVLVFTRAECSLTFLWDSLWKSSPRGTPRMHAYARILGAPNKWWLKQVMAQLRTGPPPAVRLAMPAKQCPCKNYERRAYAYDLPY